MMTWFKRYRMQVDLNRLDRNPPAEFEKYRFLPWRSELLDGHANAKFFSFRDELDSHVFPCFGSANGCEKLMKEISCRKGFVPEATWLIQFTDPFTDFTEFCGTVQGIRESDQTGSIQNLGIVPEHRGLGLGQALLRRSLDGFRRAGLANVNLEVTAHNLKALDIYRQLGFRTTKVVYKSAELTYQ